MNGKWKSGKRMLGRKKICASYSLQFRQKETQVMLNCCGQGVCPSVHANSIQKQFSCVDQDPWSRGTPVDGIIPVGSFTPIRPANKTMRINVLRQSTWEAVHNKRLGDQAYLSQYMGLCFSNHAAQSLEEPNPLLLYPDIQEVCYRSLLESPGQSIPSFAHLANDVDLLSLHPRVPLLCFTAHACVTTSHVI